MESSSPRVKRSLPTIAARNRVFGNIIRALSEKDSFLILGHANPDEDCLGSLVAFGLLARKLNKSATIFLRKPFPPQFSYLAEICGYNGIGVVSSGELSGERFSTVVVLDTPKPSMIDIDDADRRLLDDPATLKIEIDHHLETDAAYFGDEGYRLVSDASSSCELVGFLAYKIDGDVALKARFGIDDLFTRNLVLAVLTGIIGDSRMGKYLKTARERRLYDWVSRLFDRMLTEKTRRGSENFSSKEHIFKAIASLSRDEEKCYERVLGLRRRAPRFDLVAIPESETRALRNAFGDEAFISAVKSAADALAEQNGTFGLIAYPDDELIQFRIRRSRGYAGFDLREILSRLSFENGGGHPGAIGFRLPKASVPDVAAFCDRLVADVSAML